MANRCMNYKLYEKYFGYKNRKNDIVFFPNQSQSALNAIVYYFGGDIQDLPERMSQSRENRRYQCWNLVSTGEILAQRFLDCSIALVRPNQMKDGIFSNFSNFVPNTNEYGDPISYDTNDHIGLHHLNSLDEKLQQDNKLHLPNIILIGFSKGCVVLNQILHELTSIRMMNSRNDLSTFTSRIRKFIWLDGGHNNGDKTMIWPINENLIVTLSNLNIQTEIYVTPFQINSLNPYKKHHTEQYEIFSNLLNYQKSNTNNRSNTIINKILFSNETPSIDKHFQLLKSF